MAHRQQNWSVGAFEFVMFQSREVELVAAPEADVKQPFIVVSRQWINKRRKVRLYCRKIIPIFF